MIPVRIDGLHWVAVVRRIIAGQTIFFYSDDMNSPSTFESVKRLLSHSSTLEDFHPTDALWVNVLSYTYFPHSNECGPRTILALAIMALHPSPDEQIILPYMNPNIAQISRWWVAHTITNAHFDISPFDPTRKCDTSTLWSQVMMAKPRNLATIHTKYCDLLDVSLIASPQDDSSSLEGVNEETTIPRNHTIDISGTPVLAPNKTEEPTTETAATPFRDHTIKRWTTHRPFTPGIQPSLTIASDNLPPRELYTKHLTPYGTPIPPVDHTKYLRICAQNTQHSFRICGETFSTQTIISSLHLYEVDMFAAISPNVNWRKP